MILFKLLPVHFLLFKMALRIPWSQTSLPAQNTWSNESGSCCGVAATSAPAPLKTKLRAPATARTTRKGAKALRGERFVVRSQESASASSSSRHASIHESQHSRKFAVLGAGFAGMSVSYHLLRSSTAATQEGNKSGRTVEEEQQQQQEVHVDVFDSAGITIHCRPMQV